MQQISGKTFYLLFIIDGRQTFKKFTTVHGSKFIDPTQSNLWMNPTHVNLSASDCALYKLNLLTYLLTRHKPLLGCRLSLRHLFHHFPLFRVRTHLYVACLRIVVPASHASPRRDWKLESISCSVAVIGLISLCVLIVRFCSALCSQETSISSCRLWDLLDHVVL